MGFCFLSGDAPMAASSCLSISTMQASRISCMADLWIEPIELPDHADNPDVEGKP